QLEVDDAKNIVSPNEEANQENMKESDENAEEHNTHRENSINKLFFRVFVNNLLSCAERIEKPYYSAGIYPDVCIEYECLNINRPTKDEHPCYSDCGSNSLNPKKSSIRIKNNKNKQNASKNLAF
ncbi:16895_t:CDS:2, partial [Racocetra persica]